MFGLSFSHLVLFGVIALIVLGPEQLPEVARTIGRLLNELKRATSDLGDTFTAQLNRPDHLPPNPPPPEQQQVSQASESAPAHHPSESGSAELGAAPSTENEEKKS